MILTVIIPCFNEQGTLSIIINKVKNVDIEKEIIVVDDGSNYETKQILTDLSGQGIKVIFHEKNRGKGAAIRTALKEARGEAIIIQDADLEYDPCDYPTLLEPILLGKADVVYGSRFIGSKPRKVFSFFHYVCNKSLTLISNILTDLNLTDMETGYKVFKGDILKKIELKEDGFGFEPEVTMKLAKRKCIFYEIGIYYYGRNYSQGKKIKWRDGIWAIWCLLKYRFFD